MVELTSELCVVDIPLP